jgi:ubiquinone/menaquinone biosynthesis C-methylase UbiE
MVKTNNVQRKADQYNDPSHNYLQYWQGREYENAAEEIAIRRLLKSKHFMHAVDVGGGYGRLCVVLEDFADLVTLAEPSDQQLTLAEDYLKDYPQIERIKKQAGNLGYKAGSIDLITMVRVMHHLPDPAPEFKEISRVLSNDGYLVLEIANYTHFENRIKHILKGKKFPVEPVDIRSKINQKKEEIPFVNHNPRTVIKQLSHCNLKVEKILSVSNLRSTSIKKIVPRTVMLKAEQLMQPALAKSFFGPSTFLLVKKAR